MAQNLTLRKHDGTNWVEQHVRTSMEQVAGLSGKIGEVEAIAKGATRARVFDTVSELDAWLAVAANKTTLQIGDNLLIRAKNVPDYWWDGTEKQELETAKISLNNATSSSDGLMSKTDKTKLDGIAEGATKVTVPSDIGAAATSHTHEASDLLIPIIHVGATAPTTAKIGDFWFDESGN